MDAIDKEIAEARMVRLRTGNMRFCVSSLPKFVDALEIAVKALRQTREDGVWMRIGISGRINETLADIERVLKGEP